MRDPRSIISLITKIRDNANTLILDGLKAEGITDLAPSHGNILNSLFHTEKMRMIDIAEKIGKDKSTVTALIKKLDKYGYIEKEKCTQDSRITYIKLSEKGQNLKPLFYEISKKLISTTYKNITEEEQVLLMGLLDKIYNNFQGE